jgi:hypothetical protein
MEITAMEDIMAKTKNRLSASEVRPPEDRGAYQYIHISGYIFDPDGIDQLLAAYDKVKEAPSVRLDLREAEWMTSLGVAAIARVVAMSLESPVKQQVHVLVKPEIKERYFDERPWADGRVFTAEDELPE